MDEIKQILARLDKLEGGGVQNDNFSGMTVFKKAGQFKKNVEFDGKIGFYGNTPVAQHSSTGEAGGVTPGSGTTLTHTATFQGGAYTTGYTISDIVKALKEYGLLLP